MVEEQGVRYALIVKGLHLLLDRCVYRAGTIDNW